MCSDRLIINEEQFNLMHRVVIKTILSPSNNNFNWSILAEFPSTNSQNVHHLAAFGNTLQIHSNREESQCIAQICLSEIHSACARTRRFDPGHVAPVHQVAQNDGNILSKSC